MSFLVNTVTSTVFAWGAITADSWRKLEIALSAKGISRPQSERFTIMFQSPGGSVIGSMLLGIEIRKYKMSTSVGRPRVLPNRSYGVEPGDCASACVYAFLGGVKRIVRPQDRMLIHRTWLKPGKSAIGPAEQFVRGEVVQDVTAQLLKYVREMGASTQLVEAALRVYFVGLSRTHCGGAEKNGTWLAFLKMPRFLTYQS